MRAFQHLKAKNDPNGNAQRLFVVYELEGEEEPQFSYWKIVEVYDEGNAGMPRELRSYSRLPDVFISKSDYHSIRNTASATGVLRYGS